MHTFRITEAGLQCFPRTYGLTGDEEKAKGQRRLSSGIAELDEMMGGGIPEGDSVLIGGSSGTGKSLLGTQFIVEGLRLGEPGIVAMFEERPNEYSDRASTLASTWKHRKKKASSGCSISGPSTFRLMKRCAKLSTRCRQ
jgi:circadian clock protein KaiC